MQDPSREEGSAEIRIELLGAIDTLIVEFDTLVLALKPGHDRASQVSEAGDKDL